MTPAEARERARQRGRALAAYKHLLEYISLLDFLNPDIDKAKVIRACQFMLNEYPCDLPTSDD